jgi:hypothetical protein
MMSEQEKQEFFAQCRMIKAEREALYKKTGGQQVMVQIPLVDALLLSCMMISSDALKAIKHEDVARVLELLKDVALMRGVIDAAKGTPSEKEVESILGLQNCPEPWKYAFSCSIASAFESCSVEQQKELIDVVAGAIGLVRVSETEGDKK